MRGLWGAILLACVLPAQAATPIPIEAFAETPFLSEPQLSPDGKRIAARVFADGEERIAIYDLPADAKSQPRLVSAGSAGFRSFQWAGNERLLIAVSITRAVYGVSFPTTHFARFDLPSGHIKFLGDTKGLFGNSVIFVDPAGRHVLMSSQNSLLGSPSVDRVDLDTGTVVEVQKPKPGVWSWFADQAGMVRAGVDYGQKRLKLYYRRTPTDELRHIDTRRYPDDDGVIEMIRFAGDAANGVVVTNARTGRFGVYRYNFETDTMGDTVFEHDSVDVTGIVAAPDGAIDGVRYTDERPRTHWLNAEAAAVQRTIDRTFSDKTNIILGRSTNGNRLLIWSGAGHDPGSYYIFDRAARRMEIFAAPHAKLADATLTPVKAVRYPARDGLVIPAYLTMPGSEAKARPLIVMPHGGPFSRDSGLYDSFVQMLASRGYAVLQPNFRGSTGYGRAYAEKGYGAWGTGMIDDIDDGVAWLAAQGTIDPKRVCIMGSSYGGYAAMWAAIRHPDIYRCAVSFAGVSDMKAMMKYDANYALPRRYVREWRRKVEGEQKRDLSSISPLRHAARLNVPLLIAHGMKDKTVPPEQSKTMVAALSKSGTKVESVFYPEAGHGFTRAEDSLDFLKRVSAFLATHNPA